MKVFHGLDDFKDVQNVVVTVGTFDGVHLGHKKIIERLNDSARAIGGESVILTFFPHPRMVLYPTDNDLKLLNTLTEKVDKLKAADVNNLVIHPFTKEFSRLTATEFIRDVLIGKFNMKKIVIGYNHQFGRNREGTFEQLLDMSAIHHFEVEEIPELDMNHIAVSSTKIREALLRGEIPNANSLLGYEYSLCGKVVKGDGIGRKFGFPTANLSMEEDYKLIPEEGIYAVNVLHDSKKFQGMLYIGKRPVVHGKTVVVEVNIFDFDKQIYDEMLTVVFIKKIRNDLPFENMTQLANQMEIDKVESLKVLNS